MTQLTVDGKYLCEVHPGDDYRMIGNILWIINPDRNSRYILNGVEKEIDFSEFTSLQLESIRVKSWETSFAKEKA